MLIKYLTYYPITGMDHDGKRLSLVKNKQNHFSQPLILLSKYLETNLLWQYSTYEYSKWNGYLVQSTFYILVLLWSTFDSYLFNAKIILYHRYIIYNILLINNFSTTKKLNKIL